MDNNQLFEKLTEIKDGITEIKVEIAKIQTTVPDLTRRIGLLEASVTKLQEGHTRLFAYLAAAGFFGGVVVWVFEKAIS